MNAHRASRNSVRARSRGLTLIEVLLAVAMGAVLIVGLFGVVGNTLDSSEASRQRNESLRDLRFAMQRMTSAVRGTDLLLVPQRENPATTWRESLRKQSVPPSPGFEAYTAVLAMAMDATIDRDANGRFDADNDGDGLVNEDTSADMTNDDEAGIIGIDDDGDGLVDEGDADVNLRDDDDDEDDDNGGGRNEDPWDGIDNDGDGRVDEDAGGDRNGDGAPGVAGVDDDGDGTIDESGADNDDEEGGGNEDWLDVVAFYLVGSDLVERVPNSNPSDGADNREHVIAANVTGFAVERLTTGGRSELVSIQLALQPPGGKEESVNTVVRVGGGR